MIRVEKRNGAGNDFVLADADDLDDPSAFARTVCDRETGIAAEHADLRTGADGVLLLSIEGGQPGDDSPPRIRMRLYQPDGGTADMCGNAARCVASWGAQRTGTDEVIVDPPAGARRGVVTAPVTEVGEVGDVEIGMGRPSFDPDDVPLSGDEPLIEEPASELVGEPAVDGLLVTAVDTGVPHAVTIVEDVDAVDLDAVAPPIRYADAFSEGTNVTLAAKRPWGFDQRTYERGVEGETRACGTGAVAVGAVAARLDLVDDWPVAVRPPGGELHVAVPESGPASMRGPVELEYVAEIDPNDPTAFTPV